ncbi:MAG: hypothetical protein V4663_03330 [Bacteroidota bacterium]
MKKVMGGNAPASNCDHLTGMDNSICRYNNCMSGWSNDTHPEEEVQMQINWCCALSSAC